MMEAFLADGVLGFFIIWMFIQIDKSFKTSDDGDDKFSEHTWPNFDHDAFSDEAMSKYDWSSIACDNFDHDAFSDEAMSKYDWSSIACDNFNPDFEPTNMV